MWVCKYVSAQVCIYINIYGSVDGWMDEWMDGWMDVWWMDVYYIVWSSLVLAHMLDATWQNIPRTCTDPCCYVIGSSLVLAQTVDGTFQDLLLYNVKRRLDLPLTLDATLQDILLYLRRHLMVSERIFSCTCTDTWCYINKSSLVLAQTLEVNYRIFSCACTVAQTLGLHSKIVPRTCTNTWCYVTGCCVLGSVWGTIPFWGCSRPPTGTICIRTHALLISLGVTSWCWVGGQTFGDRGLSMLKLWRIPKASVELTNHTKRDNIRDATGTTLCNSQKLTNAFCRCFLWVLRLKTQNALELSSHAANQKIETLHRWQGNTPSPSVPIPLALANSPV